MAIDIGPNIAIGRKRGGAVSGGGGLPVYSVTFNGTTTVIDCGSGASIDNLHDNAFTVEAWIKPASGGENGGGRIFDKGGWLFFSRLVSGEIEISGFIDCATTDAQVTSIAGPTADEWIHVAMTWDDATFTVPKLWVMGNEVLTQSVTNRSGAIVSDAANTLYVGNRSAGDRTFDGDIGWMRISDNLRYTIPFQPPARYTPPVTDAHTVLLYRMLEGTGNPQDSSGNANHGTLTNGAWALQSSSELANLIAAQANIITGSGQWARTASRLNHQRNCFYAQGRYWLFYGNHNGDNGPYDLYFASSVDGVTFTAGTLLTTFPFADAQWGICYDDVTGKLHIAKNIQSGVTVSPVHDGLQYRMGTPNSDGTITWAAAWQTVIATGNNVGDWCLEVASDGKAWIAYGNSDSPDPTSGNVIALRNSATDGTWSNAAGFPATVHTAAAADAFATIAPLANGTMLAVVYEWGIDAAGIGYVIAANGTVTSDGDTTASAIGVSIQFVGPVEMASLRDGAIHLVYQDTSRNIKYRKRTAGVWGSETTLSDSARVSRRISSPRLAFGDNGAIYVLWMQGYKVWLCKYNGSSWGTPAVAVAASLQDYYEHTMPALKANGNKLQMINLLNTFVLKSYLLDV